MISFFRKIRKNLLNEGKTSRYFKYAIGEILLVVIGILLALQINNWNQERQSKEFEFKMLSELKTSLTKDIKGFEGLVDRLIKKEKAIDMILVAMKSGLTLTYLEFEDLLKKAQYSILFVYDKGPYESIKSAGLEKIKSDDLRNKIVSYYEVTIIRSSILIDDVYKRNFPILTHYQNLFKNNKLINHEFEYVQDIGYRVKKVINDKEILKAPILEEWLIEEAKSKDSYNGRLKGIINRSNIILNAVEQELNTRFKND